MKLYTIKEAVETFDLKLHNITHLTRKSQGSRTSSLLIPYRASLGTGHPCHEFSEYQCKLMVELYKTYEKIENIKRALKESHKVRS